MNKQRRAAIAAIIAVLERSGITNDDVSGALTDVRDVLSEESECLDNMPENLENSERYEKMENAVDALEDAVDELDDAVEYYEEDCDMDKFSDAVASAVESLRIAME